MKKWIEILALLLLLCGCATEKEETVKTPIEDNNAVNLLENASEKKGSDYLEMLENYVVREKNKENSEDDTSFDSFLNDVFIDGMEEDFINYHYTIIDPDRYGIEKPEVTLGEIVYETDPDISDLVKQMEELQTFDYDALSYSQQYDYEALEYSLIETLAYSFYSRYELLFNGKNDLLSNIVTNFSEFVFRNKEDVDDYLVLLKDIDRYLEDALVYTQKQAEDGIVMIDYSIDYAQDYIDGFVSKTEENELILSFEEHLETLSLSEEEKEAYKKENRDIVLNEVLPEMEKVKEELETYRGSADSEERALCAIDEDYAKLSFMLAGSDNCSVDEDYAAAEEKIEAWDEFVNDVLSDESVTNEFMECYYGQIAPFGEDYDTILSYLYEKAKEECPALNELDYQVSLLDESTASDNVVAYYMPSPIDDLDQNVIRVNPNFESEDRSYSYFVLAHEGIPGHLYQHCFFENNGAHPFRNVLSFIGYSEGYACLAMEKGFKMADVSEECGELLFINEFEGYLFSTMLDIGINYYGWSKKDVASFYVEMGYATSVSDMMTYIDEIYDYYIDCPTTLISYGQGYLKMAELEEKAKESLGKKYVSRDFLYSVLINGELPYNILEGAVDDYIEETK